MKINVHVWLYVVRFVLAWEMFQTKVIEKNAHLISVTPPPENRAVCEIMWKNMVEPGTQMAICMAHASCVRKTTDTQAE